MASEKMMLSHDGNKSTNTLDLEVLDLKQGQKSMHKNQLTPTSWPTCLSAAEAHLNPIF